MVLKALFSNPSVFLKFTKHMIKIINKSYQNIFVSFISKLPYHNALTHLDPHANSTIEN